MILFLVVEYLRPVQRLSDLSVVLLNLLICKTLSFSTVTLLFVCLGVLNCVYR